MNTILDLGEELLVDRSQLRDPFMRLIVAALGTELCSGSAWAAIDKHDLSRTVSGSLAHRKRASAETRQAASATLCHS